VLASKYRVERILGQGGMGTVLAAIDTSLERRVAIKVMLPDRASDPEGVARFLREGRAAVKLTSDHVARVFEVGVSEGRPYLVMEYLDGEDLDSLLARAGKLSVREAADYLLEACEAIAEAHSAGIVHRDLKPQNLFLAKRPNGRVTVKVLDFGISKIAQTESPKLTRSGAALGTPFYMAPEQMRSAREVDPRTDIWALGVILYELVTGRPPFLGESITAVAILVANEAPPPPRTSCPEIPEAFERLILRCLEKDPSERYPTVDALVAELEPFGSRGVASLRAPTGAAVVSVPRPGAVEGTRAVAEAGTPRLGRGVRTNASWGTTAGAALAASRGRRRAIAAASLAAGVCLSAVAAYAIFHRRPVAAAPAIAAVGTAEVLRSAAAAGEKSVVLPGALGSAATLAPLPVVVTPSSSVAVAVPPPARTTPSAHGGIVPAQHGPRPRPAPTPAVDPGSVR
jgi:serine/threonine-protein kinase